MVRIKRRSFHGVFLLTLLFKLLDSINHLLPGLSFKDVIWKSSLLSALGWKKCCHFIKCHCLLLWFCINMTMVNILKRPEQLPPWHWPWSLSSQIPSSLLFSDILIKLIFNLCVGLIHKKCLLSPIVVSSVPSPSTQWTKYFKSSSTYSG